jgi:hypothetical protein
MQTIYDIETIAVLDAKSINRRSFRSGPASRILSIYDDPEILRKRLEANVPCPLKMAIEKNGYDPANPPKLKRGHYMDPKELFYRTMKVQMAGGIDKAGRDGERFIELLTLLANGYMGRIMFKDTGSMANLTEDMVQEAITKCAMIVMRFNPWDPRATKPTLNNAFAYFTTVIRNRFYETLTCPLVGSDVFLEDLKTENQSIGDLI